MRVLYVWDADYPWDVRVEKICMTLLKYGHQVHIAARNLKILPEYENMDGLRVHRLRVFKNGSINKLFSFPAFFSPIWRRFLDKLIVEHNIELVLVRDLPLALTGIWAGKRHRIPVVFDMAEDYLALIWDIWRVRKFKGLNLLVRNPYLARYVERYALREADRILVVVDEARDTIIKKGADPRKVTIVSNTPPLESFKHSNTDVNEDLRKIANHFSAIYTGGIQMGRGIQIVLDAIPSIIKTIPNFLFVIVGDGYAVARLKEQTNKGGLQEYVLWVGWVDHKRLFDYIRISKLGIIPHLISDHVNTTIPNKIFDYMGLGIPIVASDAVPMKRILDETQSGITFKGGNHLDLVINIEKMYASDFDYGKHGIEAVQNKYNWAIDEQRLINSLHVRFNERNTYR